MVQVYLSKEMLNILDKVKLESPSFNLSNYVQRCIKELDIDDKQLSEIEANLQEALAKKEVADSLVLYWERKKKDYQDNRLLLETEKERRDRELEEKEVQALIDYILVGNIRLGVLPLAPSLSSDKARELALKYRSIPVKDRATFNQFIEEELIGITL